ncbi:MAG TPA: hypothetical protein DEG44_04520 [Candidatus Kerfeldbacteria bacterium]|nr:hypothetical protein [Candidatus Kerfeldbacteria bacterium]
MTYKQSNSSYLIRFLPNEEVATGLQQFCTDHNITGGFISGLGAAKEIEFSHFSMIAKQYTTFTKHEVEITNITGNISVEKLHLHVTIGDNTGQAFAGHLMRCIADPTVEIMITSFPATHRTLDDYSGLQLLDLK